MSKSHLRAIELLAEKIHLGAIHRQFVYWVLAGLALTGFAWLIIEFATLDEKTPGTFRWMAWSLKLHGLFAMFSLLVLGSLITNHMTRAWYLKAHLKSGLSLVILAIILIATGYWLYYFVTEESKEWVSLAHWGTALLSVLVFFIHLFSKRNGPRLDKRP